MDEAVDKQMRKNYLERRVNDLRECDIALEKQDFASIASMGHKLKGNGLSFGFPLLTELGALLEQSAKEKDLDQIQVLLNKIKSFVNEQS